MTKDRIWTLVARKLSGEATASELTEIDDLIKDESFNDLYLQAIHEYWETPPEQDEEFLEATYHLHLNRLKEQGFDLETEKDKEETQLLLFDNAQRLKARRTKGRIFFAAAIFSIASILFFTLYKPASPAVVVDNAPVAQSEVSTKSGSRTKIQLPDGSSVWLNGGSKLIYDNKNFGDKTRQVTLSGEAFFDVVKNPNKPFIIHTNKMQIKVLGTAFNVKAYPGEKNIETSLIRGSIEVTLKGHQEKIMMKPNDKLIVRNEDVLPVKLPLATKKAIAVSAPEIMSMGHLTLSKEDNTVMETAWVENKLVFDNESFEDVAIKMERWYGVIIKFSDSRMKNRHMTGTFENETVTEALAALQLLSPFTYSIKNDTVTIAK